MTTLLLTVLLVPLAVAAATWGPAPLRKAAVALAPWATGPAIVAALFVPDVRVDIPWLLLGTRLGLDLPGRLFLLAAGLLWTVSGIHARSGGVADLPRYFGFHLLAATGNFGLLLGGDVISFYVAFALMTFSAYGLVVHEGTPRARRAGHVYMVMAVMAEALLLVAFVIAVRHAGSLELAAVAEALPTAPGRDLAIAFFLAGFGIKAGAVPLHVWLPLAHPAAPIPASAVLSGAMIKAGLMGWLRVLPLGAASLPGWGAIAIALGLSAAVYGVVVGVTQRDAKTALAYSSISQMGYVNAAVGIALVEPRAAGATVLGCALYAVHHGLAKGALFLGVGLCGDLRRPGAWGWLVRIGLILPALALSGLPPFSGYLGKLALKNAAYLAPPGWGAWMVGILPVAAVGTTVLMARALTLIESRSGKAPPAHAAQRAGWFALVLAGLSLPWGLVLAMNPPWLAAIGAPRDLLVGVWPVAVGLTFAALIRWLASERAGPWSATIAPGDLLLPVEAAIRRVGEDLAPAPREAVRPTRAGRVAAAWGGAGRAAGVHDPWLLLEGRLMRWSWGTLGIVAVLWLLLLTLLGA